MWICVDTVSFGDHRRMTVLVHCTGQRSMRPRLLASWRRLQPQLASPSESLRECVFFPPCWRLACADYTFAAQSLLSIGQIASLASHVSHHLNQLIRRVRCNGAILHRQAAWQFHQGSDSLFEPAFISMQEVCFRVDLVFVPLLWTRSPSALGMPLV